MRYSLCGPVLVLLTGLAPGQTTSPASDEFTFQFNPPSGTRATTVYRMQKTRTIEGQPPVNDEAEVTTEGIFKRVGNGFEYAQKTLSATMRRNSAPVNDPTVSLLSQLRPVFTISAGGEVTDIKGFAEVEAQIKAAVSPQVAAALAPLLNEAALVGRERAEWNARYADFAGGKFKIGDSIDLQAPQPLPSGETLTYTIRTAFPRWEPCPAGSCVRIEQVYESDAAALARLATSITQKVAAAASAPPSLAPEFTKTGPRLSGSLSRLIDPRTMLIHSERVERTLTFQMNVPGKGPTPVVQHEVRSYTHTYDRP
jgi:hypothetical protein